MSIEKELKSIKKKLHILLHGRSNKRQEGVILSDCLECIKSAEGKLKAILRLEVDVYVDEEGNLNMEDANIPEGVTVNVFNYDLSNRSEDEEVDDEICIDLTGHEYVRHQYTHADCHPDPSAVLAPNEQL